MSDDGLPEVPEVDPDLLAVHDAEHARLDGMLLTEPPDSSRLLTRFALRTLVAAVANVRPSLRGGSGPPLFPTPRGFLSPFDRARLEGCAAAYRHADSRLAMVQRGYEAPPAVLPETPYVLNALTEGRMDNPDETNPGMIRGIEFGGDLPVAPYPPPPRLRCRDLLTAAVDVANHADAPPAVRAAWTLYAVGEIHPFADGNGRVARLLHLMVAGEGMPRTVDWGVTEQLRYHQDSWMATLTSRDPTRCVNLTLDLSTAGARLMTRRLRFLGELLGQLPERFAVEPPGPAVLVAVALRRAARLDDVAGDVALSYDGVLETAQVLVSRGLLARIPTDPPVTPARPSYEPTARAAMAIAESLSRSPAAAG